MGGSKKKRGAASRAKKKTSKEGKDAQSAMHEGGPSPSTVFAPSLASFFPRKRQIAQRAAVLVEDKIPPTGEEPSPSDYEPSSGTISASAQQGADVVAREKFTFDFAFDDGGEEGVGQEIPVAGEEQLKREVEEPKEQSAVHNDGPSSTSRKKRNRSRKKGTSRLPTPEEGQKDTIDDAAASFLRSLSLSVKPKQELPTTKEQVEESSDGTKDEKITSLVNPSNAKKKAKKKVKKETQKELASLGDTNFVKLVGKRPPKVSSEVERLRMRYRKRRPETAEVNEHEAGTPDSAFSFNFAV